MIVAFDHILEKLNFKLLIWLTQGLVLATGTIGIKVLISKLLNIADDVSFLCYDFDLIVENITSAGRHLQNGSCTESS